MAQSVHAENARQTLAEWRAREHLNDHVGRVVEAMRSRYPNAEAPPKLVVPILFLLRQRPLSAPEIAKELRMDQPALRQRLNRYLERAPAVPYLEKVTDGPLKGCYRLTEVGTQLVDAATASRPRLT